MLDRNMKIFLHKINLLMSFLRILTREAALNPPYTILCAGESCEVIEAVLPDQAAIEAIQEKLGLLEAEFGQRRTRRLPSRGEDEELPRLRELLSVLGKAVRLTVKPAK